MLEYPTCKIQDEWNIMRSIGLCMMWLAGVLPANNQ